jgi:hypothetical protein
MGITVQNGTLFDGLTFENFFRTDGLVGARIVGVWV